MFASACSGSRLTLVKTLVKNQSLILSPAKPYDLPLYAEKMTIAFGGFGSPKPNPNRKKYDRNVLQFIDGSAAEDRESSESSGTEDSMLEGSTTESSSS